MFFPECVVVGSHFTLGVWGWTCVFSTLLLCPQPFAARPQRGPYGRAYGELQKRCATSFRVAGMALRDIPTCFIDDDLHFLWQAQRFGDLHVHFAWQAQLW